MLTLGAEYEDTWAPARDKRRPLRQQPKESPGRAPGADVEPSWKHCETTNTTKYDTVVIHLDGASRVGAGEGLCHIVHKHEMETKPCWPGR